MNDISQNIGNACQLLMQVYSEIDKIKNECSDLLNNHSYNYSEDYSYGGKGLSLRANHSYIFVPVGENNKTGVFGITVIFFNENGIHTIESSSRPEIWFGWNVISGRDEIIRPWNFRDTLSLKARGNFTTGLALDGEIHQYNWKSEEEDSKTAKREEWNGNYIGYPLAEIKNSEHIESIINKIGIINSASN